MLKEKGRIKAVLGATDFLLEADANESYRIRDIRIYSPSVNYATVRVNRTTVAYLRCGGNLGSHANFPIQDFPHPNLYSMLIQEGIFRPIPVPSGMKVTIDDINDSDSVVYLIYDVYDSQDVRPSEPNGPESNDYDYINYGRFNTTLADGENTYDTQQTPSTLPAFPFGKVVPANHTITMHGILFSDVGNTSGTQANQQRTDRLKIVRNRKVLFDDDLNGFLYQGDASTSADVLQVGFGQSHAGGYSTVDQRKPLIFNPPLKFTEGEDVEIKVETTVVAGVANLAAADAEIGLILNAKMV